MGKKVKILASSSSASKEIKFEIIFSIRELLPNPEVESLINRAEDALRSGDKVKLINLLAILVEKLEVDTKGETHGKS